MSDNEQADEGAAGDREFKGLLDQARAGSREAVSLLVDRYRNYLCLMANEQLDPALRVKAAASDVVQESLLAAQRDLPDFRGNSHGEWLAWLRAIVVHELQRTHRTYRRTSKRQLSREQSIDAKQSTGMSHQPLIDPMITPATEAVANEESDRLAAAIGRLPDDYRRVIRMRNWEQLPFEEVAQAMGRSAEATRKLWSRAVERLRKEYEEHG